MSGTPRKDAGKITLRTVFSRSTREKLVELGVEISKHDCTKRRINWDRAAMSAPPIVRPGHELDGIKPLHQAVADPAEAGSDAPVDAMNLDRWSIKVKRSAPSSSVCRLFRVDFSVSDHLAGSDHPLDQTVMIGTPTPNSAGSE